MFARMVLAAVVLATSLLLAAPSGAQGCYPPPCGPAGAAAEPSADQGTVQVAGIPGAEQTPRARELSRTGSPGVLPELTVAGGLLLVGGTLVVITRRRLRLGPLQLDGA